MIGGFIVRLFTLTSLCFISSLASASLAMESCKKYYLHNLSENSVCETKSRKTLYKELDAITIIDESFNNNRGLRWHKPSEGQALTLAQARVYCDSKGFRLPQVDEVRDFLADTFSERLGGITSCNNVGRTFFDAKATSSRGSENVVPVEGKGSWRQRNFEIAVLNLKYNTLDTRYEEQKFNVMCVEDVNRSPKIAENKVHDCSEYWWPSTDLGTQCNTKDGGIMSKTLNGYKFSNGPDINVSKNDEVRSYMDALVYCQDQGSELLNFKTLESILYSIESPKSGHAPQLFCIDTFAGSEKAFVTNTNTNSVHTWNFTRNALYDHASNGDNYRVVCEQ